MNDSVIDFPSLQESEGWPLIPPGTYEVKLVTHRTATAFGQPRLVLSFSICTFGSYFGVQLPRYYNVKKFIGKPGHKGRFYPKERGDFLFEFFTLFNRKARLDRIPMEPFYNNTFRARVATVHKDGNGRQLPELMKYSKVAALLAIVD